MLSNSSIYINNIPVPIVIVDSSLKIVYKNNECFSLKLDLEVNTSIKKYISDFKETIKRSMRILTIDEIKKDCMISVVFIPPDKEHMYVFIEPFVLECKISIKNYYINQLINDINPHISNIISNLISSKTDNEIVENIKVESSKFIAFINNVKDYIKLESGIIKPNNEEVLLYKSIFDISSILNAEFKNYPVKFTLNNTLEEDFKINIDYNLFKQVLLNTLINSLRFNKKEGNIFLNSYKNGDNIYIDIEDTGIGMNSLQRKNIFVSSYNLETKTSSVKGLGMVVSKKKIRLIGGDLLIVKSTEEKGTIMRISLPINVKKETSKNKIKVLFVYNNIVTVNIVKFFLTKTSIYSNIIIDKINYEDSPYLDEKYDLIFLEDSSCSDRNKINDFIKLYNYNSFFVLITKNKNIDLQEMKVNYSLLEPIEKDHVIFCIQSFLYSYIEY